MPSVQIKNVPDDVHATLRRRAALAGQSLQEYLLERLTREARTTSIEEVFDRMEREESGGSISLAEATALIRADRDARS